MKWDKNKITENQLLQLFINDLLINSECRTNAKYMENKQREWAILKQNRISSDYNTILLGIIRRINITFLITLKTIVIFL